MTAMMFNYTMTPDSQSQMWAQLKAAEDRRLQYQQAANAAVAQSIGDFHQRVTRRPRGQTRTPGKAKLTDDELIARVSALITELE